VEPQFFWHIIPSTERFIVVVVILVLVLFWGMDVGLEYIVCRVF